MMPFEHWMIFEYPRLDIETQVRMQIALAKHYAKDYLDMAISSTELKSEISWALHVDMVQHENQEKYEYCILYKDTIDNLEFISIDKLF